jgi:hypothetical protein
MPIVQGPGFNSGGVDTRLLDILSSAAASMPGGWTIKEISGKREGDPRFHGQGLATDIQLVDPSGKAIPNYQSAEGYNAYQNFAHQARAIQMQKYPELGNAFRWGGYFWNGGPGNYGNADLMHFDLGGDRVGMGGGSWEGGPSAQMRAAYKLGPGGGMTGVTAPTPAAGAAGAPAPDQNTMAGMMAAAAANDPMTSLADSMGAAGSATKGNAAQTGYNQQALDMESMQDRQAQANLTASMGQAYPASPAAQELGARYQQAKMAGGPTEGGAPLADLFKLKDMGQAKQLRRASSGIAGIQPASPFGGGTS